MQHLQQFDDGVVRAGAYQTLLVDGDVRFEEGVAFGTLWVTGTLHAPSLHGSRLVCAGIVECGRNAVVHSIEGHGQFRVGGDIECTTMTFAGEIHCDGDVRCDDAIHMDGHLDNSHRIDARDLQVQGVLATGDLRSSQVTLRPLDFHLLRRMNMEEYCCASQVRTLKADVVDAAGLRCGVIDAARVKLSDDSHVEHVRYSESLDVDGSSSIMLLEDRRSRSRSHSREA